MLNIWLLPKDSPFINMDAHLASSRPARHTHPYPLLMNPWAQSAKGGREGGRKATGVFVIYRNKALDATWPKYYTRPNIPAPPSLPNPREGRRGSLPSPQHPTCFATERHHYTDPFLLSYFSPLRPIHCARALLKGCHPHGWQCDWCPLELGHTLSPSLLPQPHTP